MRANHHPVPRIAALSLVWAAVYVLVVVSAWRQSTFAGSPSRAPDAAAVAREALAGQGAPAVCATLLSRYVAARYAAEVASRYPPVMRFARRTEKWFEAFVAAECPATSMLVANVQAIEAFAGGSQP